ncbi:MAG: PHP domain protein [Candidatus Gottesmanbacteria bacterium GW2011_GWA2_44_17]|uniref:PHP domain protein n=1 Tax=Candidatus Gottesmanbacteria bacterium GW2011_GWA2_44_17 TaxID=1618444 RepID=A0A0G1HFT7_9BACT|nr:MAG: PHP domain protein [Candidatus Gottesmanbacteria bacterium GW2011_GWA2_44_17]
MNNREVAELLGNVAAAYEVLEENPFKIRAYSQAGEAVANLSEDIRGDWEEGKLDDVPGVGPAIRSHLDELFRTGKVKHFEEVFKKLPAGLFPLLNVPGVGPKSAFKLAKQLGIDKEHNAIARLKKAGEQGEIEKIEGFGKESQEKILVGIEELLRRENKMLLPEAAELAERVIEYLKKSPQVLRVEMLGSLRRRASLVGDVDLAAATKNPEAVVRHFVDFPEWKQVLAEGGITARAIHRSGRQVDLKTESPERFGALLQHFTGSKAHNVALREYSLTKGFSLSEHGIKISKGPTLPRQGPTLKNFKTEEEFYKFLGLVWIPPEMREDRGEIEAGKLNGLPKLMELPQVKGDLHIHSNIDIETSHDLGASPLSEIVNQAEKMGYEYIAITDHNPSVSKHSEKQIVSLIKMRNESIDEFIRSRGMSMKTRVFKSLEIDILPDGRLSVPEEVLDFLDFVMVSIHSSFREIRADQTQRLIRALSYPKVKILGHPTGRKLLERDGIDCDWGEIFVVCKKRNIYLEVNANPRRLDLPDDLIKQAIEAGVKLSLGTDSHQVENMELMRYGVDQTRRGWAERKDVINCLGYNEIAKLLIVNC